MFKKDDTVYCSCLNKTGVVIEKREHTWLYNVHVKFLEDDTSSKYTYDGKFNVTGERCLNHVFKVGDQLRENKKRFTDEKLEVVEIDETSDFPLKVSDGKIRRSYTLDGRYDYNSPIELTKL